MKTLLERAQQKHELDDEDYEENEDCFLTLTGLNDAVDRNWKPLACVTDEVYDSIAALSHEHYKKRLSAIAFTGCEKQWRVPNFDFIGCL